MKCTPGRYREKNKLNKKKSLEEEIISMTTVFKMKMRLTPLPYIHTQVNAFLSESGHGKSSPDGAYSIPKAPKAVLKRTADMLVSQGKDIPDLESLMTHLKNNIQGVVIQEVHESGIYEISKLQRHDDSTSSEEIQNEINIEYQNPLRTWERKWISRRNVHGASYQLFKELSVEDPRELKDSLRISEAAFEYLLSKVGPMIQREDTFMRSALPAKVKLTRTMFNTCSVMDCERRRSNVPYVAFYKIPKSETGLLWLKCLKLKHLQNLNSVQLDKCFVCAKHFEKRCFTSSQLRSRLHQSAIPTLFTESEINNAVPDETGNVSYVAAELIDHDYSRKRKHQDYSYCKVEIVKKQKQSQTDHALVFMLRGAVHKWQQPITFFFCKGATSSYQLKKIIKDLVTAVSNAGLIPLALICDQGTSFVASLKSLQEETKREQSICNEITDDTIKINGHSLSIIYDPPHLIKGIRNNFITKDIKYKNCLSKWSDIVDVYITDCNHAQIRLLHKLNDEHGKVKNCVRVLSKTVAATLAYTAQFSHYADGREVSSPPLQSLLVTRFIKFHSESFNCEEDSGEQLLNLQSLFEPIKEDTGSSCTTSANNPVLHDESSCVGSDRHETNISPESSNRVLLSALQGRLNVHSRAYTTGWVIRKILNKIECIDCKNDLASKESNVDKHSLNNWISIREYKSIKTKKLTYPSEQAVRLFGLIND
ncbi:hypothetical protein evm_012901 [Chilo suppressalis]|nr:hypothetical protein evm_012901 [Chilo suppressalis]